jgi:hypothetical protein
MDGDGVLVAGGVTVADDEPVGVLVLVGVPVFDSLDDAEAVMLSVDEAVVVEVSVGVGVLSGVPVAVCETEGCTADVLEALGVPVCAALGVPLPLPLPVVVSVPVPVEVGVGVGVGDVALVFDCELEGVSDDVPETLGVPLSLPVCVGLSLPVGVPLSLPVGVPLIVIVALSTALDEEVNVAGADGERLGVGDRVGDGVAVAAAVPVTVVVGVADGTRQLLITTLPAVPLAPATADCVISVVAVKAEPTSTGSTKELPPPPPA